jgi:predicted lipase
MKKLKRYQYERYAILCQMAYDESFSGAPENISKFNQINLTDRYNRVGVRVLWTKDKKEVIVVFRGSLNVSDWLGNFCFFPDRLHAHNTSHWVHWGFKRLLLQPMRLELGEGTMKPLNQLLIDVLTPLVTQGKRIAFTGHSSGGAVAVLMADMFERTFPKKVKRVVTFGQPAAGTRQFYKNYCLHKRTYRICCDLDMVTFLPPLPYYFWHVGKMLWLHDDRIYENMSTHERLLISLKSWVLRPITYHFMRKYIRNKTLFDEH